MTKNKLEAIFRSKKHKQTQTQLQQMGKQSFFLHRLSFWKRKVKLIVVSLLVLFIGSFIALTILIKQLPSPKNLTNNTHYNVSTQIFDRHGQLLYEIYADENRIPIKLATLPPYVKQATIAIEDRNFYHHFGFDLKGILRAAKNNLLGETIEGGSTITQQLVKNALLTRKKTLKRKLKELILAMLTETIYTKDQILEMYLNYISYGGTAVGIEAAAEQYFGKSAHDLTLPEAALLAGLPQAPSRYSPFQSDQTAAKKRQAEVLRRMVEDGYITQAQADKAKKTVLHYALSRKDIKAPHFVFYIKDLLIKKYGRDKVTKGGLRVTTTLDLGLQETAQASLSAEINKLKRYRVGNGAALIAKPNTGEILAMIGSRNYFDSQHDGQVNVTLALRQPGSSIKPLVYATDFQQRLLNPGTILIDQKTCFQISGQKDYCPRNYDDQFHGLVSVRQALGNSFNIPAVKAMKLLGVKNFIDQAQKMGLTSLKDPSHYGLSLGLGAGEVRMIDMVQAFSVLANEGVKVPLNPILTIKDYRGNLLYQAQPQKTSKNLLEMNEYPDIIHRENLTRVMDQAPAYLVDHIMQDNQARTAAFGPHSQLVIPNQVVSVKTGTTNDLKDNWTIGFTPQYIVATWVGNNDSKPMNPYLVSGVTGAAPIWHDIMRFILQGKSPQWPEKPVDVRSGDVCPNGFPTTITNLTDLCQTKTKELYWEKGQPSAGEIKTENTWIDPTTGQPPAYGQQVEGLKLENHRFYVDPTGAKYCLDCRPINDTK